MKKQIAKIAKKKPATKTRRTDNAESSAKRIVLMRARLVLHDVENAFKELQERLEDGEALANAYATFVRRIRP